MSLKVIDYTALQNWLRPQLAYTTNKLSEFVIRMF